MAATQATEYKSTEYKELCHMETILKKEKQVDEVLIEYLAYKRMNYS